MSLSNDQNEETSGSEEIRQRLQRRELIKEKPEAIEEPRPSGTPDVTPEVDQQYVRYMTPDEIVAFVNGGKIKPSKIDILRRWQSRGGVIGAIATLVLFLYNVAGPAIFLLAKLKVFLLAGGSAAISIFLESRIFGWPLAAGIVALIFIHECGHALAARIRGIPTGIMVFIPFMGAFVTTKRFGKSLEEDAFIGIMGPLVGSAASLITASFYFVDHQKFWLVLGDWGLFINLFNLLPTPPLDGGWIAPLFSPKLLAIGAVLGFIAGFRNPLIWLLLLLSAGRIISGWRADPKTQPYYQVAASDRWKYGVLYFGLAAALALSSTIIAKYA